MSKERKEHRSANQEDQSFKDSDMRHLFEAEKIINTIDFSNRTTAREKDKRKKVYVHWVEFLFKNTGTLTILGTLLFFYIAALFNFRALAHNFYYYGVDPIAAMTNYGTTDSVTIGICLVLILASPFLLYLYLNIDCYMTTGGDKMSYALTSFCINYTCNSIVVFIPVLYLAPAHFELNICYFLIIPFLVGLSSNFLICIVCYIKHIKINFVVLFAAIASFAFFCLAIVLLNFVFSYLKLKPLIMAVLIFASVIPVSILTVTIQKRRTTIENREKDNKRDQCTEDKEISCSSSTKRFNLILSLTFPALSVIALISLMFVFMPFSSTSTIAKVAAFDNSYYIVAADYGNNVCLEPLIVDNETRQKIADLQNGSFGEDLTITSNTVNTKVKRMISRNSLETIDVTYNLIE